jgi:6-phosphofructokinase 1
MEDARTMGRWYFITTMGRHAGHLALGMGKAAGATISLIPEEFSENQVSFKKVADTLTGSIIKRISMGRDYGVAILAEGISEKFDPEELKSCEAVEKNEAGELRLSEIQLGRVLKHVVNQTLESMGLKVGIVDKNIGYELRAANPIPFDVEYTRDLGYGAVRFLLKGGTGSMIVSYEGNIRPVPFVELINYSTGKVKIRKVDINTETYEVARKYMIRLEQEDFQDERLKNLAKIAQMEPAEFKSRFEYVALNNQFC